MDSVGQQAVLDNKVNKALRVHLEALDYKVSEVHLVQAENVVLLVRQALLVWQDLLGRLD